MNSWRDLLQAAFGSGIRFMLSNKMKETTPGLSGVSCRYLGGNCFQDRQLVSLLIVPFPELPLIADHGFRLHDPGEETELPVGPVLGGIGQERMPSQDPHGNRQ